MLLRVQEARLRGLGSLLVLGLRNSSDSSALLEPVTIHIFQILHHLLLGKEKSFHSSHQMVQEAR